MFRKMASVKFTIEIYILSFIYEVLYPEKDGFWRRNVDEVSNTSARGDMMWRAAIVETCHRAFWIQGHRTEQSTQCGDLSQSNHEPVIKSKRESRRHSHRDFIPTLRKSQSAGFRVEIMSRFLDWMQND